MAFLLQNLVEYALRSKARVFSYEEIIAPCPNHFRWTWIARFQNVLVDQCRFAVLLLPACKVLPESQAKYTVLVVGFPRWAQRLKRVFDIDVEFCDQCGGTIKVIACLEDPAVINKILDHLDIKATTEQARRPQSRASQQAGLFNGSPA